MGGANSQPQGGLKIGGTTGGGGFGKIMEGLSAKVSFDPNTGAVSVRKTSPDGNASSETTFVPNDQLQDLGQYISTLSQNMKAGTTQNPGVYPVTANMMAFDAIGTQVGAESVGTALPSVTAWQIKNPPARAAVYTDKAGASKFLYKNDPGNVIQLVQNGSKIAAAASQQGATSKQADMAMTVNECEKFRKMMAMCGPPPAAGTSTYASQGVVYPIEVGGYPAWVVILSIASIVAALVMVKKST
jgi:hypothetical protein